MLIKSIGQKQITSVSLWAVLGLSGISWLTTAAIAPQTAQAYTAKVNVSLNRQLGESYESFLRRAEAVARAAAQRSFDGDILVTEVAVTIIGENNGAIAPLLSLEVSRQSWRSRPDPQRWARYFPNTESLLGFNRPNVGAETPSAAETPPPVPTPPPPSEPTIINIEGTPVRVVIPPAPPEAVPQQAAPPPAAPGDPEATPQQAAPGTPAAPAAPGTTPQQAAPGTPAAPAAPGTTPQQAAPETPAAPAAPGATPQQAAPPPPAPAAPATTPGSNLPSSQPQR